ncbi:MAG: MlaD family protein [bacterium]
MRKKLFSYFLVFLTSGLLSFMGERMTGISTEAKVGLFVIIGILVLIYMTFNVGGLPLGKKKGFILNAIFDSVAGVEEESPVKVAGVEVGKVESITLKSGKAYVALRINYAIEIFQDATATVRAQGLMGEKYIEIIAGDPNKPLLKDNDNVYVKIENADIDVLTAKLSSIADDVKAVTTSLSNVLGNKDGQLGMETIFNNMKELTTNLNEIIGENQKKLGNIMNNFEELSGSLNNTVGSNRENLETIIHNVEDVTKTLKDEIPKITSAMQGVIDENRGNVQGSIENIKEASNKLNEVLISVGSVTKKIDKGEGTIGKLVSDDEAYTNLNDTLTGLNDFLNKADSFKTFLNFNSEYLTDNDSVKSTFSLKLQPREDKYFILGIVNSSDGFTSIKTSKTTKKEEGITTVTDTKEETTDKNLRFNLLIAKRFYDLTLRGGLIESTGGVGIDYDLFDNKLKLSLDAWDFGEDEPHLKFTSNLTFHRHIFVRAGVDNFVDREHSGVFVGMGISFEDKDIKYLLGKIPISNN